MHEAGTDRLLLQFLSTEEESESERALAQILDEVARPIISRIVRSKARGPAAPEESEDLISDTQADLLRRLRDLKSNPSRPIRDLRGYIATCAYNRCHERLRESYPARNRLRNHLQYLFSHHPQLSLWRTDDCRLVCGDRRWMGQQDVREVREELSIAARSDPSAEDRTQIARLVSEVFRRVGAPMELDYVVDVVGSLIHLEQRRVDLPLDTLMPAGGRSAEQDLELRTSLRELWQDIALLSPRQRAALLLNLRDSHGREIISLFPRTRTATIAEIARAVEVPLKEFAELWRDLPLSDAAIAERLGASSEQVIKLRRLARERLRRLAERREETQTIGQRQKVTAPSPSSSTGLPANPKLGGRAGR